MLQCYLQEGIDHVSLTGGTLMFMIDGDKSYSQGRKSNNRRFSGPKHAPTVQRISEIFQHVLDTSRLSSMALVLAT